MRAQEHIDRIVAGAAGPWHPDSFNCEHCPGNGCPAWWTERWERADADGVVRERSNEGCGFRLAQAMFVRALGLSETVGKVVEERTNEIAKKQDAHTEAAKSTLKGVLVLAAAASGNPAAVAIAPLLPRILGAAKRLLPGRKGKN